MRELTIVLPHYMNLSMLAEQRRVWTNYPVDLRARVHAIVVDDCSPKGQRPDRRRDWATDIASFRIYHLQHKKRWNWLACRNLGAKLATTTWLLMTDMDHVVPAETLRRILDGELDARNAYRFKRVTAPSAWPYDIATADKWKVHNDSWLLTRDLFFDDRVFGYDERLSGAYGTSGEFKDRVFAVARALVQLNEVLVRYPREVIADASTLPSVYTRKNDPVNDEILRRLKEKRAQIADWKPLHGLIPYEEVYNSAEVPA